MTAIYVTQSELHDKTAVACPILVIFYTDCEVALGIYNTSKIPLSKLSTLTDIFAFY